MTGTIMALVTCQNDYCANECSYPLDLVRMLDGRPICEGCYDDGDYSDYGEPAPDGTAGGRWVDLPPVRLVDLKE